MNENQKVLGSNWQNPTQGTAIGVGLDLGPTLYLPGCLKSTSERGRYSGSLCCHTPSLSLAPF